MTDEVQRSLDYNLWRRRWPEASMLSDGESATVPNSQVLGQLQETFTSFISDTELQETFTPFISDTEQQEGGLTTPVDPPLTGQNFWDLVWEIQAKLKAREFQAKLKAREIQAKLKAREFQVKLALDRWKALNRLKALKTLHAMQTSDMLKALDALEASDLLDALDVLEALEQRVHWGKARLKARLERIRALRIFRWTLTKKVPASFSLKELISLLKSLRSGWGPPLELATRMLNSKFWVMEADVWADLLIVCCWANPTIYCKECGKDVESVTTSCNHVVCPVCAVGQGNGLRCPECKQTSTVLICTSALATAQEKPIRKRRLYEPPTTATKRPCTDSGKSMVTRSRSKAAKQTKQVSAIPLTTPDPPPPALTGSCSLESESNSFTIKDLHELLEYLYPALNEWYYLGLALGLPDHDLKAIETKQRDNCKDCLREMLSTRLKEEQKLSKKELIQSLQTRSVGLFELAQKLKAVVIPN